MVRIDISKLFESMDQQYGEEKSKQNSYWNNRLNEDSKLEDEKVLDYYKYIESINERKN